MVTNIPHSDYPPNLDAPHKKAPGMDLLVGVSGLGRIPQFPK